MAGIESHKMSESLLDYSTYIDKLNKRIDETLEITNLIQKSKISAKQNAALKKINSTILKKLNKERKERKNMEGLPKKLQMSKRCLTSLSNSNAKMAVRAKNAEKKVGKIKKQIKTVKSEINGKSKQLKQMQPDIKEQLYLKSTL